MGKDLDDDAYSDSERGSVTIKGVTGGDFQIKTSIINGVFQLRKCLSSGKIVKLKIRIKYE